MIFIDFLRVQTTCFPTRRLKEFIQLPIVTKQKKKRRGFYLVKLFQDFLKPVLI